jgi:hypothetical protein
MIYESSIYFAVNRRLSVPVQYKYDVAGNFNWRRRLQRSEETNHANNRQVRQERQEFGF